MAMILEERHAVPHAPAYQIFFQVRQKIVADLTRVVAHCPRGRFGTSQSM